MRFETACEVFFDPFLYALEDDEYTDGELREKVIGLTQGWQLLYVVFVMREDSVRLVSARAATAAERLKYESQ